MDVHEDAIGVYPNQAIDPRTGRHAATGEEIEVPYWARVDDGTCRIVKNSRVYLVSNGIEVYEDGCSHCNGYLSEDDNYCPNCGRRVC